jgi:predicted dehydrogenase
MNIGIIGTGNIANTMAYAISKIDNARLYAVASRSKEHASSFAKRWNFQKSYGSYEELAADNNIDLIYIATPHSSHFEDAKMCIEHGQNVLVEKPFAVNSSQVKELITMAKEKDVFISEAMWTRFMPSKNIIKDVINEGIIGDVKSVNAQFSLPISHVERLVNPNLAGGALLDLGVYALTFAAMYLGTDIDNICGQCEKYETGVDATDSIKLQYKNQTVAALKSSMILPEANYGIIYGTQGKIYIEGINNPVNIEIRDNNDNVVRKLDVPKQINGYEYELTACMKAISEGKNMCEEITHNDSMIIMNWMDSLRHQWNILYPCE